MHIIFGRLLPFLICLLTQSTASAVDFGVMQPFPPTIGQRVWNLTATDLDGDGQQDIVHSVFLNTPEVRVRALRRNATGWDAPIDLGISTNLISCLKGMGRYVLVGYRDGINPDNTKFRVWDYDTTNWLSGTITTEAATVVDCSLMALKAGNSVTTYNLVIAFTQNGFASGRGYGVYRRTTLGWFPVIFDGVPNNPSPGHITQTRVDEFVIGRNDGVRGNFFQINEISNAPLPGFTPTVEEKTYSYINEYDMGGPVWKVFNTLYFFAIGLVTAAFHG